MAGVVIWAAGINDVRTSHVTCPSVSFRRSGTRSGAQAEKIKAAFKTEVRLRVTEQIGAGRSRGLRFWFVGIRWRERWYARIGRWCVRIRRFLPAATPVCGGGGMAGSGVGVPGGIESRKTINGKLTTRSFQLRNRLNLSRVDRAMRRIKSSGHHHSLSL